MFARDPLTEAMTATKPLPPAAITAYQCVSAAGDDVEALWTNLRANRTCLKPIELRARSPKCH